MFKMQFTAKSFILATCFACTRLLVLVDAQALFTQDVATIDTRSLDEIYAAAQSESGPLNIAAGGDYNDQAAGLIEGWNAQFPKIQLNISVDLSKYVDSQIDRSYYAHDEYVDVTLLQTLQNFPRWKSQNRLLSYKPSNFDDIDNELKDNDGAFLPVFIYSFGDFYYDSTKVSAPETYADLLDPKWKGKLVLTYPNDDDAVLYLFSIIVEKYGFGWFDALVAQDVQWVRGTATPYFAIVNATLANGTEYVNGSQAVEHPALSFSTVAYPPTVPAVKSVLQSAGEQSMAWAQTAAIFASTKRPETAKLFMSWLLSTGFQSALAKTGPTPLKSLNAQSGYDVHSSNVTQTSGFPLWMQDRARVGWWKLQFETSLGPPLGPDPANINLSPFPESLRA